jgi:uncharacterized membrane protein
MALTLDKYKSQIIIGVVALVTILGVCLYAYFDIKHKNALAAEIAVQQFQIEQMKIQAEMIQKDQAAIIKHSQQMIQNLTKIRTESAEQQKKITKYDLDKIGAKHPKVLENHINKATKDTFSRLEALTQP